MLKKKIEFHNMEHSVPLEQHALEKIKKIEDLIQKEKEGGPLYLEVWLKANTQHPHNSVEIKLKTSRFDLAVKDEAINLYVALDNAIDNQENLAKRDNFINNCKIY